MSRCERRGGKDLGGIWKVQHFLTIAFTLLKGVNRFGTRLRIYPKHVLGIFVL
jgi:hypothetical protein